MIRRVAWLAVGLMLAGCRGRATTEPTTAEAGTRGPHEVVEPARDRARPPELVAQLDAVVLPPAGAGLWVCADGRVRRWSFSPAPALEADCARGLRLSADGSTVLAASERAISVHDTVNGGAPRHITLGLASGDHIVDVALSPGGRRAAVTTHAGAVKTVELADGRVREVQAPSRVGSSRSSADDSTFGRLDVALEVATPRLVWSGDEKTLGLAAAVRDVEAETVRGRLFTWDVNHPAHTSSDPFEVLDRRGRGYLSVAASPSGGRFVVGTADGVVRLFDRQRLVWSSAAATAHATTIAFAADGRRFAVAFSDGAIRIFGPVGTADALELWPDAGDPITMAFSAGGDKLALGVEGGLIAIIDAGTGQVVARVGVLDRGWVVVSASGSVDGTDTGLDALAREHVAGALGWARDQSAREHRSAGLLARLLGPARSG